MVFISVMSEEDSRVLYYFLNFVKIINLRTSGDLFVVSSEQNGVGLSRRLSCRQGFALVCWMAYLVPA